MVVVVNAATAKKVNNNIIIASITSCTFIDNVAENGGAILSDGNMTVTNCIFINNTAEYGGAIFNGLHIKAAAPVKAKAVALLDTLSSSSTDNGPCLTIRKSSFVDNNAINGDGGVIATTGDANINFSRIIGNSAINGSSIYNPGDLMDASLNWWGSNMDPSSNVTVKPWLILKMIANPNIIKMVLHKLQQSYCTIQMVCIMTPTIGKLPEGIPVTFTGSDGTFNPTSGILMDGQAKSLFTANANGKTSISTTIDNQTVTISITLDLQTITSNSNNPTTSTKSHIKTILMQHTGTHPRINFSNTNSYWWYNIP
jgi:predicted outer membrane repeat protein